MENWHSQQEYFLIKIDLMMFAFIYQYFQINGNNTVQKIEKSHIKKVP